MNIVTIKTDAPEAELGLFKDTSIIESFAWTAHRQLAETIHLRLQDLLLRNDMTLKNIDGFACYSGPGSFTGLRIGLAATNALAYGLDVAVVASKSDDWQALAIKKLLHGDNEFTALPEYGAPVHITQQKK